MNRIKRIISILCIILMCTTLAPSAAVFAADGDGVVTVSGDYVPANSQDNIVVTDAQTQFAAGGNVTMVTNEDNSVTFSVKGNGTSQGRKAITGSWINSGYMELTFDYQFTGTVPTDATYTQQFNLHVGAWFNGPTLKTDGSKYTIKAVMDLNNVDANGKVSVVYYEKAYNAADSEYTQVAKNTNTKPSDISVLQPHWKVTTSNYPDETTAYNGMTIDKLNIIEKPVVEIEDLSGGGELYTGDPMDVNFFLPNNYKTATLKVNNKDVVTYTPTEYPTGSYKATIPLTTDYVGTDVPVELVATDVFDVEHTVSTTIDKVVDIAARELEFSGFSGEHRNDESLEVTFYLPVGYTSATLKIDGNTVKTYTPDEYPQRKQPYTDSISLLGYEGRTDVPIGLYAQVNGSEQKVEGMIGSVIDGFIPEIIKVPSGIYTDIDTVNIGISLPEHYTSAHIEVAGEVVKEYSSADTSYGKYDYSLNFAGFAGKNVPVKLYATVNGIDKESEIKTFDEIVPVTSASLVAEEDFSDQEYSITIWNGTVENGVLTDDTTGSNHTAKKASLTVSNGYCADLEYDVKVSSTGSSIGAFVRGYEKNSTDNYFPLEGGWFYTQSNGSFSVNPEATYNVDEWNTVKYRMFNEKDMMYVYLNGEYIGSRPMTDCFGFSEIGVGWNSFGSKVYIDNVKITSWIPYYNVNVSSEPINYSSPEIKLDFDIAMSTESLTQENITITSFNGRNIEYDKVYDSTNHDLVITPKEDLIPDKEYTISISSNVKSLAGISNADNQVVIKTKPQPFRMVEPAVSLGSITSSTTSVNIPLSVVAGAADNATIFVALYRDGKLISIKTANVVNGVLSNSSVTLTPSGAGQYTVSLFMCNGINNYAAIDDITINE